MALIKICDNCKSGLGGDHPFVQTKGSVSDQYEPGNGVVEFRYLTSRDETHTFCDDACDMAWRAKQRSKKEFVSRYSDDPNVQVNI